jgi:hypothetical protein
MPIIKSYGICPLAYLRVRLKNNAKAHPKTCYCFISWKFSYPLWRHLFIRNVQVSKVAQGNCGAIFSFLGAKFVIAWPRQPLSYSNYPQDDHGATIEGVYSRSRWYLNRHFFGIDLWQLLSRERTPYGR